jgi:uncharacterized protein involved in outer membrane biogenesis
MIKKILAVLAVLVVVVVFLAARDWDSPELGRALLDKVGAATGIQMKAEGFRLNLLRGLVLEKVEAASRTEGRTFDFTLDRLVFEHRLLPLLSGKVAVDEVVLERPQFTLVQGEGSKTEPPPPADSGEGGGAGLALEVKEIRIADGALVVKNPKGQEKTRIEDLDLTMRNVGFDPAHTSLAALSAEGDLAIENLSFDTLQIRDAKGVFELRESRFTVPELSFSMPSGRFVTDATFDFNSVPVTYELKGKGDPLDLNGMVGASEGFGPAMIELDAKGEGPETKDLDATGRLSLAEGQFPAAKMFTYIDEALGKKVVAGASYKATEANFKMDDNRVRLAPFRFETQNARIDLKGVVNLEGPIDLDLSLATPREGIQIEGVGASALDLLADDQGWVPIPIDVTGTLEDPKVRPDVKELASQAGRGATREATEKATEALGGLLKRKKN